jgi:hypothetical protein
MRVKANVILARCSNERETYGMRIEEKEGDWIRTWAFPVRQEMAEREGFDKVEIHGSFLATEEYPGCPYCKGSGFFVCSGCGKISCYHGESITCCKWCGRSAGTETRDKLDVSGGGF